MARCVPKALGPLGELHARKQTENDQQNKQTKNSTSYRYLKVAPERKRVLATIPDIFFYFSEILNHIMEKFVYWINAN
jgi:hypothetical protein